MANVVEVTLRGKDETTDLMKSLKDLKKGLVGFAAFIGLKAAINNIKEADKAATDLDSAYKAASKTIGLTRDSMDDLATSLQKTTVYSDDLVKQAEAILLTFDRVRGEAFERTVKVATDLSARLGTDLVTAVRSLGIALSDPEKGLDRLRRSGVVVSEELRSMVKNLVEAGRTSQAQSLILTELETKFKGAAAAARGTLGGALEGLGNAFGDLFEGTKEGTAGAVDAINGLSDALSNPDFKGAVDKLISGLAQIAALAVKAATAITGLFESTNLKTVQGVDKKISEVEAEIAKRTGRKQVGRGGSVAGEDPTEAPRRLRGGAAANLSAYIEDLKRLKTLRDQLAAQSKGASSGDGATSPVAAILGVSEVQIKDVKRELGAYAELLKQLNDSTKTASETQVANYYEMKEALKLLREEGIITQQQFEERVGEAIDDSLMIDIDPIRSMYKDVKTETTELGEFMKGVWRGAGEAIRSSISDAVYEGKISLNSLVDIGRRVVADLISAFLTSGLKNLFTGKGGGSGFWGSLAGAFGFSAGGGSTTRARWVGEEGPELVVPGRGGMSVYNKRQLASMGGNGTSFAPVTNITLIEREDPERTKREVLEVVAMQNSKQLAEFQRTLNRNGVEVK